MAGQISVVRTKKVPLDDLQTHPRNPRTGNLPLLRESLRTYGQYKPIVVNGTTILAGNHTFRAAREEGWKEILCSFIECDEETALKIVLIDNSSSDQAAYDLVRLQEVLESVPDLEGTGFQKDDLQEIRKRIEGQDKGRDRPEIDFSPELLEAHNYVVLYFDKETDWLTAQEVLGLKTAGALDYRKGYERAGIGRVIPGTPVIRRIQGA